MQEMRDSRLKIERNWALPVVDCLLVMSSEDHSDHTFSFAFIQVSVNG